ncbi:MAG: bifunctional UDP-3-O-[3-hydroxymyristoyl] N-acetylglucosamine deacetylase/3-hydroxyacyl-ACP dehydratase [Muribaculaceae bacterium]
MKQLTLKESFAVRGKGLHTGLDIEATFLPAPENHGYAFQRTDVEGMPVIQAVAENVVNTNRGTVIANGEVTVSTIEHCMAALYAAGVDNVLVQVNGAEVPILDGSADEFVKKIQEVGLVEQAADKEFFVVRNKIEVYDEASGAKLVVLPDDEFSVDVKINYDSPVLGNQYAILENIKDFGKEIAPSRTFVFVREIEQLVKANLIKGGDLDNAIVIYDTPLGQEHLDSIADMMGAPRIHVSQYGFINEKPLRWDNEPARHKLLDVIGDIALIGRPLKGRVLATRPGHSINTSLAKELRRDVKRMDVIAPVYNPNKAPLMDNIEVRKHLPHRFPFLLVDKIIDKGDQYIVGIKNVTNDEPFFQGHFPDEPIMPGVLIIEAMAQTGGLLVLSSVEESERYSTYFMKIDNVKFRQKVIPGDTLIFHVSFLTELRRGCAMMKGRAFVGDKLVCEAEFMAQIIKNK